MERDLIHTDETLEVACVIKSICDEYRVDPSDLRIFPPANHILADSSQIRFKKRLTIKIPLVAEMAPKYYAWHKGGNYPHLRFLRLRNTVPDSLYSTSPLIGDNSQIGRLGIGLGEFELRLKNKIIQFWLWNGSQDYYLLGGNSAYFVRKEDVLGLTFFIKRSQCLNKANVDMPILPSEMITEIYKNSVGFLLKGRDMQDQYKKYRIPYKRGILLSGRPGCGKTMTCRWLRELCEQNNLAYRVITMEDYHEATRRSRVRALFKLRGRKSGIAFFDDMDIMVKNRKKGGGGPELSTFLSELDGIDPTEGVVYVFTTNYIEELDEAFVRPGRIDLWLPFQLPSRKLRQKFINQRFNEEIKKHIDVEDILERTQEYSFAELEEIRKLMCMDLIDEKKINVNETFKIFDKHRKDFEERAIMGFGTLENEDNDIYGDDQDDFPDIFIPQPRHR